MFFSKVNLIVLLIGTGMNRDLFVTFMCLIEMLTDVFSLQSTERILAMKVTEVMFDGNDFGTCKCNYACRMHVCVASVQFCYQIIQHNNGEEYL